MNIFQSELFGSIAAPTSISDILILAKDHSKNRRNVHLWRGQTDITWPIHSSAFRRLSLKSSHVTERSMQSYETYLLEHATHQGYRYDNGRLLSDFELLAKLQHHGAATRLIDCSRNLLVALWFACNSEPNKHGLLFGIHSDHLGGSENTQENSPYHEVFLDLEQFEHPQTWQPPVVSKRIAAQSAQFLYSSVSNSKMGSLRIEEEQSSFIAMAIEPKLKNELLEVLSGSFDIRHLTLFPDIDGFGYANSYRYPQYESQRW